MRQLTGATVKPRLKSAEGLKYDTRTQTHQQSTVSYNYGSDSSYDNNVHLHRSLIEQSGVGIVVSAYKM